MINSKYGLDTNFGHVPVKLQSWWWRDLVKVCKEGGGEGWFLEQVGWNLGNGDKVRFWEDVWVGNSTLKTLYPRLYSLSLNQGQKVEEVGACDDLEWRWTLNWRRSRFEWESDLEYELGNHISRVRVRKDVEDTLLWRSSADGVFSVRAAYECLSKPERIPKKEVYTLL